MSIFTYTLLLSSSLALSKDKLNPRLSVDVRIILRPNEPVKS